MVAQDTFCMYCCYYCILNYSYIFLTALGLHCCVGVLYCGKRGLLSSCAAQALHCIHCRAWALGVWASVSCSSWTLECGLSGCGAQAWLLLGMWDLPGPGVKSVPYALAGRF